MKKLLFMALLLAPGLAWSQAHLDSLYAVWQDEGMPDSSRIDAYYYYVREGFMDSNPDSAFVLADALIAFGEDEKDLRAEGNGYKIKGTANLQMGKYAQALENFIQSLAKFEQMGNPKAIARISNTAGIVCETQGNYSEAVVYYERALTIWEQLGNQDGMARVFGNLSQTYGKQGNYPLELDYLLRSLKLFEQAGDLRNAASGRLNLGKLYINQNDPLKARIYTQEALDAFEKEGDQPGVSRALNNLGLICKMQDSVSQALEYYSQSLAIKTELGDQFRMAGTIASIGILYRDQANYPEALNYFFRALAIMENLGGKGRMATMLGDIGIIHNLNGNHSAALSFCLRSLNLHQEIDALVGQVYACECLYEGYKALGNSNEALRYHELMTALEDSVYNEENTKKIARLEAQYEYQKQALADSIEFAKEAQIKDLQIAEQQASLGQQRIALGAVLIGLLLIAALAYAIFRGKKRSDELLLNILPAETAAELKATGVAAAKEYAKVSVLFSDFKGFTQLASRLSAAELVAELNVCFKAFDEIMATYGLEKIKTIGDAYMAAGGLPDPLRASSRDVVNAGLAMQQFIAQRKVACEAEGKPYFEMRVGIHTGPVIAGVVGVKKFQYDVWGDTVNTASRMESKGAIGEVNVSAATYTILKDEPDFSFEARGAIEAKGKGKMDMYFVRMAAVSTFPEN